ncbi:TPA_asm: UL31.5 uORF 2 RNA *1 [Human alphaherpesvirus 1]|nr:TPA_asm: UL31.5 uORF 2 RNA *1 [Human alphaherpesvirus 1]
MGVGVIHRYTGCAPGTGARSSGV